jgi:ankyrin repeat protein
LSNSVTELFRHLNSNSLDKLRGLLAQGNVNAYGASEQSLLHIGVSRSNADAVRLLLDEGARVDALDGNGSTPLVYAASRRNYDVAELLLKAGADPNLKGRLGMTPIRWAVTNSSGDFRLVRLLLQYGANPWIRNDAGSDAVDYADTVFPDLAEELKRVAPK